MAMARLVISPQVTRLSESREGSWPAVAFTMLLSSIQKTELLAPLIQHQEEELLLTFPCKGSISPTFLEHFAQII